jgi:hypothetical protein
MAVIKIENFGGEMPSTSARALPGDAAQINQNLLLASREFRPLLNDTVLTGAGNTGLNGAKTLFRVASGSAWRLSTSELNYARGQNSGDTTQRTYYSNNTTAGPLRVFDNTGNDRQLGVPAPGALTVTTTAGAVFTAESLVDSIRRAIENSIDITEPGIRYSGSTILAGPQNPLGAGLYLPTDAANLPSQVRNKNLYYNIYAKVLLTRIEAMQIDLTDIAVTYTDATHAYIPILALPYCYVQNGVSLSTSLPAIVNPRTSAVILSEAQVNSIIADVTAAFDVNTHSYSLRTEITTAVDEFYNILFVYPAEAPVIPGIGVGDDPAVDPRGLGPTPPTGPYLVSGEGGLVPAEEWLTYDQLLTEYNFNRIVYNENKGLAEKYNTSAAERIRAVQAKAETASRALEAAQLTIWNTITQSPDWVSSRISQLVVSDKVIVDSPRVIQTRYYLATFVSDRDEESAPSAPSAEQIVDQYSSTVVTQPTVPSSRNITKWRIYRSASTGDLTTFQYVTEALIATTTFTDTVSNEALGEIIETIDWAEPVSGLKGLVSMPNGIMAAFKDNTLHFSEPYVPYAFPVKYQITTEFPIVGLGVYGQTLFVGTTGNPYLVSGSDSASMSAVKLESNQACVAQRSIATVPGGVIYASPDGLCYVSGPVVRVITRGIYTRDDWQQLNPTTIFAAIHEDIYYFFCDETVAGSPVRKCYAFDVQNTKLGRVSNTTTVTAIYAEMETDALFVADGANIIRVFTTGSRTGVWKSPIIIMPAQTPMAWLRVFFRDNTSTSAVVKWYADGELRHTATVTNSTPVRLPAGRWLEHEVEVESASRITRVELVSTTEELKQV